MSDLNYIEDLTLSGEYSPLWFHTAGRQQTASGYGSRLVTPYMVQWNGRKRRVFCMCWSNSGTLYVMCKGERWIIRGDIEVGNLLISTD